MKLSDYRVYPMTLIEDRKEGGWTICVDDFPGCTTEADREEEIDDWALAAFCDLAEASLRTRRAVPAATQAKSGQRALPIPPTISLKIMLRNAMIAKGVSYADLARKLGVSPQSVAQTLTLKRRATNFDSLIEIFEALDIKVEVLVEKMRTAK